MEFDKAFINKIYLDNNEEEAEIDLLFKKDKFEIYGTTRTIDKSDYYVTIYLNGYMINGYRNMSPELVRISITKPEYIQYDRLLTKQEKQWFIDYITNNNNWNMVLEYLTYGYKMIGQNVEYHGTCPDYSSLDTID